MSPQRAARGGRRLRRVDRALRHQGHARGARGAGPSASHRPRRNRRGQHRPRSRDESGRRRDEYTGRQLGRGGGIDDRAPDCPGPQRLAGQCRPARRPLGTQEVHGRRTRRQDPRRDRARTHRSRSRAARSRDYGWKCSATTRSCRARWRWTSESTTPSWTTLLQSFRHRLAARAAYRRHVPHDRCRGDQEDETRRANHQLRTRWIDRRGRRCSKHSNRVRWAEPRSTFSRPNLRRISAWSTTPMSSRHRTSGHPPARPRYACRHRDRRQDQELPHGWSDPRRGQLPVARPRGLRGGRPRDGPRRTTGQLPFTDRGRRCVQTGGAQRREPLRNTR